MFSATQAATTTITTTEVEAYQRTGYLSGPRLLDDNQITTLREEVLRVIDTRDDSTRPQPALLHQMGSAATPIWQICNICWASPAFDALIHDPVLLDWAGQLSGAAHLRLWHDQIQYKPSHHGGVNMWHQDGPYWPCLTPPHAMITAWIALDDADVDNGCMSMVPGSHRWGDTIDLLHTITDFDRLPQMPGGEALAAIPRPVTAGHVHFHHPLTWHGSPANRSGRPRRALAIHFATDAVRVDLSRQHLMKPWITSTDGEALAGDMFPVLWKK